MTDLVKRLRHSAAVGDVLDYPCTVERYLTEAADRIEALEAENANFKRTLLVFAECDLNESNCASLKVATARIRSTARAALNSEVVNANDDHEFHWISRAQASNIRSAIATVLGVDDKELARKLADAYLAAQEPQP